MMEEGDRNSSGHFDDLNKTLFGGDATLENLDGEEVEGEEEEGEPIEDVLNYMIMILVK